MTHGEPRRTLIRFLIAGGLNTAFSYAVYAVFLHFGAAYPLASLGALGLGILSGFALQGSWVFRQLGGAVFLRFVLVWGCIYAFSVWLIGLWVAMGLDSYTAGLAALPFNVALSYLMQRYVVFRRPSNRASC